MNTAEIMKRVTIAVAGPDGLGRMELLSDAQPLVIAPVSAVLVPVRVRADAGTVRGSVGIQFIIEVSDGDAAGVFAVREKSTFFVPAGGR